MNRWYVAQTHAQAEAKALLNLARQGFQSYLPQYVKRRRHARRVEWVKAPLFPRYLFVRFDRDVVRWRAILSTAGVSWLICNQDKPAPVPEGVVEDIRVREDERGMIRLGTLAPLARGDRVQITAGAFADHLGLFECASDHERVIVLLRLLGREVRVAIPSHSVLAAA